MKYLVAIQQSSGILNATIFDTLSEAKTHLKELAAELKYPITVDWIDDESFKVRITQTDWTKVWIVRTERAEYRLISHMNHVGTDEERRFSTRENAVKYVEEHYINGTVQQRVLGYWASDFRNAYSYKLYAVIQDPETKRVRRRFSAATSQGFIFDGFIDDYEVPEPEPEASDDENGVILKKKLSKKKTTKKKKKRRIIIGITVAVLATVGIVLALQDWQVIADEIKARNYSPSEEVKSLAYSLSLTRKGKAAFFASNPKLLTSREFNRTCGSDGNATAYIGGCYYKDKDKDEEHIEVYNVGTSSINENGLSYSFSEYRKSITLHETLHAIWVRIDEKKQKTICDDLKTLQSQITGLKDELKYYDNSSVCTELFARVGSEYIQILSPKNSIPSSSSVPVRNSSLNYSGKNAVTNLVKVYDEYFDTTNYSWVVKYWQNETNLNNYVASANNYKARLDLKWQYTQSLINQCNYWPTWSRCYAADNAIDEYNGMVNVYNSYVNTINKVRTKLDSQAAMKAGSYLGL